MRHRTDIDGLRAIAVLPVILFHLGLNILPGGFVGVDIFFVISGFLITSIIHREITAGRFSIVDFYERRARRIFPVLFAMLSAVLAFGFLFLAPHNLVDLGKSTVSATVFASNIYFWLSIGYFEVAADARPLLHTWSLAVEEQFYLFFPLFLIVLEKSNRWKKLLLLLAVLASLAIAIRLGRSGASFYLLPSRAFELGIGSLLALEALPPCADRRVARLCGLAGLVTLGAALIWMTPDLPFPGPWALIPTLGAALILYAGTHQLTAAGRLLSLAPLRFVGLISYSAYMWHWPMIVATRYLLAGPIPAIVQVGLFAAILGVAALSWKYIEQPFRDFDRFGRRAIFGLSGAGAAAIILAGAVAWATNGLPARFPYGPTPIGAESVRLHSCFLDFGDRPERWSGHKCEVAPGEADNPTVFVWGDSFAAHYVPGLTRLAEARNRFRLVQANYAACPPLLGDEARLDPRCAAFNARVYRAIASTAPRVVILAASWSHAEEAFGHRDEELARLLGNTIGFLRKAGVRDVLIVGDSPRYYLDVEQLNLNARGGYATPRNGDNHGPALEATARRLGGEYVSPMQFLCQRGRCRFRDDAGKILQWDDGHFTLAGSDYMAAHLLAHPLQRLLAPPR